MNSSQGGGSKDTWVVDATLSDLDEPMWCRPTTPGGRPTWRAPAATHRAEQGHRIHARELAQ